MNAPNLAALYRPNLSVEIEGEDAFEVREFSVAERMSSLFEISVTAVCANPDADLEAPIGRPASFSAAPGNGPSSSRRRWQGICAEFYQVGTEARGLAVYQIRIVPRLWLATQRIDFRTFQHKSEPDIAVELLEEWKIDYELRIDRDAYPTRDFRVQYGETDFALFCRMLENAGISFFFEHGDGPTTLVLADAPQSAEPRDEALPYVEEPAFGGGRREHATGAEIGRRLRPGRLIVRDHDHRRPPSYATGASAASGGPTPEADLELFEYAPGAFRCGVDGSGAGAADDRGRIRCSEAEGKRLARTRLEQARGAALPIRFFTNAPDIAPGVVLSIVGHPHRLLDPSRTLLVVATTLCGTDDGEWVRHCECQSAAVSYRPPRATAKRRARGTQSATVVGPPGEEIHCDEFGRVRVHFHWDRQSKMDDKSSCWLHVAQASAGAGHGCASIPRVGEEVLVQFIDGDPDRPVVVGRVHTDLQKPTHKLPDHKTRSGWRSCSTGRTGGYNEIVFEDEAGKEQLSIRAERDLVQRVRNDAEIEIGRDRATRIADRDTTEVGKSLTLTMSTEASGAAGVHLEEGKLVLTTGQGATITLEGDRIILSAARIEVAAGDTLALEAGASIMANPKIAEG